MKKLTLNVEELAVDQFATEAVSQERVWKADAAEATKWWSGCPVHTCYC